MWLLPLGKCVAQVALRTRWVLQVNQVDRQPTGQSLPSEKEEAAYAVAYAELTERSARRPGLWAKALAESGGDEARAESLYLLWRSGQLQEKAVEAELHSTMAAGSEKEVGAPPIASCVTDRDDDRARNPAALILVLLLVVIGGMVWIGSGDSKPTVSTSPLQVEESAPVAGPAAIAAADSKGNQASVLASGSAEYSLFASAFNWRTDLSPTILAARYEQEPWHACAVKMAASVIGWGGCQFSGSRCGNQGPTMQMSELRRDPTAYGTEFTLHSHGIDPTGSSYAKNYACHIGRQNQLLSFKEVDL